MHPLAPWILEDGMAPHDHGEDGLILRVVIDVVSKVMGWETFVSLLARRHGICTLPIVHCL